jgi:hypothetical protein
MNIADLFASLSQEFPGLTVPPEVSAYLAQQQALDHQIRRAGSGQPLIAYLEEIGVAYGRVARLFAPDSRLNVAISFPELLQKPALEIGRLLTGQLAILFELQEIILDRETRVGFNRHGREHLKVVAKRVSRLLSIVDIEAEQRRATDNEACIAGYLHDTGNIVSRKHHSFYSAYLLSLLMRDTDRDPQTLASFRRVIEAIIFHEVEASQHLLALEQLSPAALSLIVADKSDVSSQRVSQRSNVPDAGNDLHILLNLLAARSHIVCRKNRVTWEILFSPGATQQQTAMFPELLKRAQRVWVPKEWQRLYRQDNIEYVLIFNAAFLRIYFPRLLLAIRAVFALSPSVDTFELVINDAERGVSLKRQFHRDDYQKKLAMISKNLFKNRAQADSRDADPQPGPSEE